MNGMKSATLASISNFSDDPGILYLHSRKQMLDSFKREMVRRASCVDMLGWNLWESWFEVRAIAREFETRATSPNFEMRVLLPKKNGLFYKFLCGNRIAFGLPHTDVQGEELMRRHDHTVRHLKGLLSDRFEDTVRFLPFQAVFSGTVRCGEIMAVTHYSTRSRGSASLTLLLHKNAGRREARELYEFWATEFNTLWTETRRPTPK